MGLRSADEVPRRIADLGLHDAYAVLGVPSDASAERIAQAYRRAMLHDHPDRGGSPDRAQLINCAYEVLSRYRDVYDAGRGGWPDERAEAGAASEGPCTPDDDESVPLRVEPEPGADEGPPPRRSSHRRLLWFAGVAAVVLVIAIVGRHQLTGVAPGDAARPQLWTASQLGTASKAAPDLSPSGSRPISPAAALPGAPDRSPDGAPDRSPDGSPSATPPPPGHQCVVHPDSTLWCWGAGGRGELGNGGLRDVTVPVRAGTPDDHWVTVSAGARTTCALRSDAGLWCWGDNSFGQLGDGTTTARSVPARIAARSAWLAVATGTHTCAVRSDHTLWCWGAGEHGELGDGTSVGRAGVQQVGAEATWAAVTVEEARTCAVRQNGTTSCWGATT
jgi:hypothetical protein